MAFQENHTLVSHLMCLTGVGPYPGVAGSRITKFITWYGRVLHIGLYIAIICLDTQYFIHKHFKLDISRYVLIVITILLSNLLTAYNLQIQKKEAGLKKCYRVLNEVYEQLKTRKINVGKRYINYYITLYVILEMVVCGLYAEFSSMCRQSGVLSYVAAIHFFQQYIQMLITIRFIYFIQNIHVALVMVNKRLKIIYNSHFHRTELNLTTQTNKKRRCRVAFEVRSKTLPFSTDNVKEPTEYAIRKIALSYSKLCQLIYVINDKDGAGLLWMTVYMTINIIMSMYNQLLEITNVDRGKTAIVLPTLWLIITTTRLVLLTEQCHRIHEQMGNTRHHLSRLKCSFRDVAVSNELDLFQCLTVLRRPTFSPQDMFTLTRTFCTKLARLGYFKLAAASAVPVNSEQRPRNGIHHSGPKETKSKAVSMDTDSLVLWKKPVQTLEYFLRELLILCSTGLQRLLGYKLVALTLVSLLASTTAAYYINGPHQSLVQEAVSTLAWWGWWVGLGVLSSVGLGTGLHTFLLYLGPHIARVTLAAYECGSLDFPTPPYPNDIICPTTINPNTAVTIWSIMSKVRIECMMWGMGTALGELPPYFMARAARLSGGAATELQESSSSKAKVMVQKLVQRVGFAGILACASIPNPLFDLAGLTCGHFLVPFWTFFGATLLGKAVIKMHIQKMFVIIAFNEALVGQALTWVEKIPYIGPKLEEPLLEFLKNQKARLHKNDVAGMESQGSILSSLLEKFVMAMVLYFVVSIVHALAQNYSKRIGKKKGKKKE